MDNPYWHTDFKPHLTDRNEIRGLCFDISNIVTASRSKQGTGEEYETDEIPVFSRTDKLCFELAERELSRRLLRLALLVRTFDDTMSRAEAAQTYTEHRKTVDTEDGPYGAVYEGKDTITDDLRECSNKLIHAEDVRPTYETEDDSHDPNARWGMTGELECKGRQGNKEWSVSIYLDLYLDGVLHLIEFEEPATATTVL